MIVCHRRQDTFFACNRYFAYASITQSVMLPYVESKLMPTFVMGFPLSLAGICCRVICGTKVPKISQCLMMGIILIDKTNHPSSQPTVHPKRTNCQQVPLL